MNSSDLSSRIDLVQNNVNFSLTLTWAILAVIVTVLSITITILVRVWVNHLVKKTLRTLSNDVQNLKNTDVELANKINGIIKTSSSDQGWGYIHFGDGTHICYLKVRAPEKSSTVRYAFPCSFEKKESIIPTISVLNNQYVNACIKSIDKSGITVLIDIPNNVKSLNEDETEISIIAIGKFN